MKKNQIKDIRLLVFCFSLINLAFDLFWFFFMWFCKISNFNMWTVKHLAQACCTEFTLLVSPMTATLDYVFRRRTLTQQQLWPLQWPFQFFCGNTVDLTFIYLGIGMTRLILFLSNCLFHLLFIPKQFINAKGLSDFNYISIVVF